MIAEKINLAPIINQMEGWCTAEKAERIYQLIIDTNSQFTVELGTWGGRSLIPMALAHKEKNSGFALGIDAWKVDACLSPENSEANDEWYKSVDFKYIYDCCQKEIFKNRVQDFCDTFRSRTDYASFIFANNTIDVLHEDSSHNESTIIAELNHWIPKVKIGGYWIADDTHWKEVKTAYSKLPDYGLELVEDYETWQIHRKVR